MGAWAPPGHTPPQPPQPWQPLPAPGPRRNRVPVAVALAVAGAGALLAIVSILVMPGGGADYATLHHPSAAMEPTYPAGDDVTVRHIDGSQVRRGDVVLFAPHDWGTDDGLFMLRAVAVGGDHLVIPVGGQATLNGRPLNEPYLYKADPDTTVPVDVTVPPGRLFLLGDHRSDAADSRYHRTAYDGTIAESAVFGIAVDPHDVPSPDHRLTWLGAALTAAALLAALLLTLTPRRRRFI